MAASKYMSNFNKNKNCASQIITTIFFDLDNTLIPTRKADLKACNKVSDLFCFHFMLSEFKINIFFYFYLYFSMTLKILRSQGWETIFSSSFDVLKCGNIVKFTLNFDSGIQLSFFFAQTE